MNEKYIIGKNQIEWLKNNYPLLGAKECSIRINIPETKIRKFASSLGIKISQERFLKKQMENGIKSIEKNTKYHLNYEQIEWLKNNYPLLGGKCSEYLKVPNKYIYGLAVKLGLKVSPETIIKNKSGKVPYNKKYSLNPKQLEWLKDNYALLGAKECSKTLGVPNYIVLNFAAKNQMKVSPETRSKIQSYISTMGHYKKRKKVLSESRDIKITNPEQAYTLGFLWGDGYLNCPKNTKCCYPYIGIQREDFDRVIKTFQSLGNWHIYYRKCNDRKEQGEAYLCNNTMGYFMRTNDYKLKSHTSPKKILSIIPENIKHYWWRGYIDADGCFYINETRNICQFSLSGSYDQDWSKFEELLTFLKIKYRIRRRIQNEKSKSSIVSISKRTSITKLGNYLYCGEKNIGLERKYKKFLAIKEKSKCNKE